MTHSDFLIVMEFRHNVKIMTWNVKGLFYTDEHDNRICKLHVSEIQNELLDFDIVCLQETWCTDMQAQDLENEIFKVFYSNRSFRHPNSKKISGGVMVLIKKSILSGIKRMPSSVDDSIWLKLDKKYFGLSKDVYLSCLYLPPENSSLFSWYNVNILDFIEMDITRYMRSGDILLCGDFNARTRNLADYIVNDDRDISFLPDIYVPDDFHINRRNMDMKSINNYGKWLTDLCMSANLCILNGRTLGDLLGHYTSHQPEGLSVIDYNIISKHLYNKVTSFQVGLLTEYSDHCPLRLNLQCKLQKILPKALGSNKINETFKYVWEEESKSKFLNALIQNTDLLHDYENKSYANSQTEVDLAVDNFESMIQTVCKNSIKRKIISRKRHSKKITKHYTFDLKCYNIRTQLKYVLKLKNKYPHNREIREDYYYIKRLYQKCVKKSKSQAKADLLSKLENLYNTDSKSYWEIFNKLRNDKGYISDAINPDTWLDYYKTLCKKPDESDEIFFQKLNQLEQECSNLDFLDLDITDKEIYDTISNLKNNKSPGLDGIVNEMVKNGKFYLVPLLKKLFNLILSSGYYPNQWKKGLVINIFKSGEKEMPENYRGITLTSCLGKIYSLILNNRLVNYLIDSGIYSNYQFGFKPDNRTTDAIAIFKEVVTTYKLNNKNLYICFIDFKKAFDRVWRAGLLLKLLQYGVGGNFYKTLKSMYSNNKSAIKVRGGRTDFFPCEVGVRQGDGLSPSLFNIFINDLPDLLNGAECEPAKIGNVLIGCLMYADDLVIMSESKVGLQKSLNTLAKYCNMWKICINASKSKTMVMYKRRKHENLNFKVGDETLDRVKQYKYLGFTFTQTGSMIKGQEILCKKALKCWFLIRKSLYNEKVWPIKIYIRSFESAIKPILLYASEIWGLDMITDKNDKYIMPELDTSRWCEKVIIRLSKQILQVSNKASNMPVLAELGRTPLYCDITINVLKYFTRIQNMKECNLVKKIFDVRLSKIFESVFKDAHKSVGFGNDLDIQCLSEKQNYKSYFDEFNKKLVIVWHKRFFRYLQNDENKKLVTYKLLKITYDQEPYLTYIENPYIRKKFTSLRISSHPLRIESGRYRNIDKEKRFCQICCNSVIENEMHFMLKCPIYETVRTIYLKHIIEKFCTKKDEEKTLVYLLSTTQKDIIDDVSKYIYKAFEIRDSYFRK